jgi:hypothetical protein
MGIKSPVKNRNVPKKIKNYVNLLLLLRPNDVVLRVKVPIGKRKLHYMPRLGGRKSGRGRRVSFFMLLVLFH